MIGLVDDQLRALIEIPISAGPTLPRSSLRVWIDTAFNGTLVIPRDQILQLGLQKASSSDAILADGMQVELPTYICHVDWFGQEYRTQIISNEGRFPLLGTQLLAGRRLLIDYDERTVFLE